MLPKAIFAFTAGKATTIGAPEEVSFPRLFAGLHDDTM